MHKRTAILLSAIVCFSILVGCVPSKKNKKSGVISQVEVTIEAANDETQILRIATGDSVTSYITARMYLEQFLQYDIDSGNSDEYSELLNKTISAFETSETLSANLLAAADVFEDDSVDV